MLSYIFNPFLWESLFTIMQLVYSLTLFDQIYKILHNKSGFNISLLWAAGAFLCNFTGAVFLTITCSFVGSIGLWLNAIQYTTIICLVLYFGKESK
jgi:hypothetical protein